MRLRINPGHHELGKCTRRVKLTGVACTLQIVEQLFIYIAKVLSLGEVIKIDLAYFVDNLTNQLTIFHVVVGVLKYASHYTRTICILTSPSKLL